MSAALSEAELIGQPHNIVRHPDMPVEAFADMWQDMKGWTSVDRHGQKSLQEWRPLLGAGYGDADT
jgi:hypothetical protein